MTPVQIAMLLSLCGMAATLVSFHPKNKKHVLLLQILGNVFYLASYFFAGGNIAVILNVIYVVRNLTFLFRCEKEEKPGSSHVAVLLFLAAIFVGYGLYTWLSASTPGESLLNLLPVAGAVFGTVAVRQSNLNRFRLWKLGDSACWLTYNLILGLGALGGIIGEVLNLCSLAVAIFRNREKKPPVR